jgi:GH25 family lysozyme M1 (1,4-beta-N-acetylmuramidase)
MEKYPDISHYHPVTDWDKVKKYCPFLISKATQGRNYIDPMLYDFIEHCEQKEIPYWLYAFLNKGEEYLQAEFLVKICKPKVGKYFRGYILDVESGNQAEDVKTALDYLERQEYKTMLYTMYGQYRQYKTVIKNRGSNCAWWEARYGLNNGIYNWRYRCHRGADLQQFTSVGRCPGIKGEVDLNRITGRKGKGLSWFTKDLLITIMMHFHAYRCTQLRNGQSL